MTRKSKNTKILLQVSYVYSNSFIVLLEIVLPIASTEFSKKNQQLASQLQDEFIKNVQRFSTSQCVKDFKEDMRVMIPSLYDCLYIYYLEYYVENICYISNEKQRVN